MSIMSLFNFINVLKCLFDSHKYLYSHLVPFLQPFLLNFLLLLTSNNADEHTHTDLPSCLWPQMAQGHSSDTRLFVIVHFVGVNLEFIRESWGVWGCAWVSVCRIWGFRQMNQQSHINIPTHLLNKNNTVSHYVSILRPYSRYNTISVFTEKSLDSEDQTVQEPSTLHPEPKQNHLYL